MVKNILVTILAGTLLLGNARAESCAAYGKLEAEVEQVSKDLSESVTPWGVEWELDSLREKWSLLIHHVKLCKACRQDIATETKNGTEQEIDEEIRRVNEATLARFDDIQRTVDKSKDDLAEDFWIGFKSALIILPILFGGN